mgnify:CR=1 FL=1
MPASATSSPGTALPSFSAPALPGSLEHLCPVPAALQRHYSGAATQTALVTLSAAALSSAAANLVTPAKTNLTTNLVTPGQSLPRLTTFVAGHSDRTGHGPNSGLKSQRGVCVDGDGVFVCDTGRDRVVKFELSNPNPNPNPNP